MEHSEVLIVGGGNAGISLAARLRRDGAPGVTVVAPQPVHRYKPLLNYVGGGQAAMADLERPMRDVVPDGCEWIRDSVEAVDPAAMTVRTRVGRTLHCSTLVLCPGLVEDWDATPGLQSAYNDGWAASTYVPGSAPQVWPRLTSLRAGSVLFTVPPEPASCGPTALKPLLMACDHWRRAGVLPDLDVRLVLPAATATGVPEADGILDRTFETYGVEVLREARIERVDWDVHAVTVATGAGRRVLEDVAFAHAVPHYRAPGWIADAGLAADPAPGLVDVDPHTLRSRRHQSIWAIGDAADVATRPSGGALRKQVDVVARNIAAARNGEPVQRYDGYTVIPITLSRRKLVLVEVDRDGRPSPSVPFLDPIKPRRSTWFLDRYALPAIYFRRILRGRV
ncbi:NAD(P)/FAD-dependent oxidoreductase [Geodermatophilus obscurus]|uniref:FAD-dependent pyridine nucleotide-disulphide oxidoreductase n=1 Tax=Geodermatophilus obscurus (strain ATCC 25078 / DSM 43160 / JCM 3152 / CCUG 61914 / KCC A-0152 / KCTC 9177 / NBRC 13315 / NRRL B-3577 / G-20) TaxID=526225 RepID=D2S9T2_GEOOG|nr:FAD/NAD(P)-binding oxidoreductase [Geodermatophilus obscurus]ADB73795.1 FAD-dependent pyridine nucleotide-disulphide oxidoreductase [Geodermatophilus obscurus DSM 43160]